MDGENIEHGIEQEQPQGSEWDILTEEQSVNIEPDPSVQSPEDPDTEPVSQGIMRVETSLPPIIEDARRALVRRSAPNTMPRIETIYRDRSRQGISYIDDLCENWPIFIHAPSVEIDGQETYFPQYFPQIDFDPTYGRGYSGFLSTPKRLGQQYDAIRSKIGKKNASIYFEACMDNPLVARIRFGTYPGNNNSDHCCAWKGPDGLYHGRIRLIDEALPLSDDLARLEARMTGTKYLSSAEDPKELECIDTVHRAEIIYHEIGHDVDFILNHLRLQSAEHVDNRDIETAITSQSERRSRDIECSKSIPGMALWRENIRPDELAVILERRGFDLRFAYDNSRLLDYNSRRYREMPCESVADAYSRMAVCVRHRDHYFAKKSARTRPGPRKEVSTDIWRDGIYGDSVRSRDGGLSRSRVD